MITILPWMILIFAVASGLTFGDGLAPLWYLATALLAGSVWLYLLMNIWKKNHLFWHVLSVSFLLCTHRIYERAFHYEAETGHFCQWLLILVSVVGCVVYFKKQQIIEYCGLKEMTASSLGDGGF